jgi:FlgN protein
MNDDAFAALRKAASIEITAWDRLEASLRDEASALKSQVLPAITKSNIQKDMAINSVRIAADNRKKVLSAVGLRLGMKPPFTMEHLFDVATDGQRQEMYSWQAKFAASGTTINTLNKKNMDAIKTSLAVVSDSIRFLNNILQTVPSYTSGGQISAQPLQGRIVSKRG